MEKKYSWRTSRKAHKKDPSWFWAVGILTTGGAIAGLIANNGLLSLLIIAGGFAIMVAGARPKTSHSYAVSDSGFHIDGYIVSWDKIERFRIKRNEGALVIQTQTLLGATEIPLKEELLTDIEMELKNRNIEEDDELESVVEILMRTIGL